MRVHGAESTASVPEYDRPMAETASGLIAALRDGGYRVTLQRRIVCDVLAAAPGEHLDAAEIVARSGETLDLSTVYRTLDVFEQLGVLHHVHLGHGPGIYHLSERTDHHHLMCEHCGQVVDVPLDALETSFAGIVADYGFVPDGIHFAILGRHVQCPTGD